MPKKQKRVLLHLYDPIVNHSRDTFKVFLACRLFFAVELHFLEVCE